MFYTWLELILAVLLCAAMWLNRACWRSFVVCLIVGAGLFLPAPWIYPVCFWYLRLFAVEMVVICGALALRAPISAPVMIFTSLLAMVHLFGLIFGPSKGIGPYRLTQPMLEVAQILACVVLSHSAREFYKRRAFRAILERSSK